MRVSRLKWIPRMLVLLLFAIAVVGCAWKAYDPHNPSEYWEHWSKQENKRKSLLYCLSEEGQVDVVCRGRSVSVPEAPASNRP